MVWVSVMAREGGMVGGLRRLLHRGGVSGEASEGSAAKQEPKTMTKEELLRWLDVVPNGAKIKVDGEAVKAFRIDKENNTFSLYTRYWFMSTFEEFMAKIRER